MLFGLLKRNSFRDINPATERPATLLRQWVLGLPYQCGGWLWLWPRFHLCLGVFSAGCHRALGFLSGSEVRSSPSPMREELGRWLPMRFLSSTGEKSWANTFVKKHRRWLRIIAGIIKILTFQAAFAGCPAGGSNSCEFGYARCLSALKKVMFRSGQRVICDDDAPFHVL